jgi:hypothetical protein
VRIQCDKSHSGIFYGARSVLNAPTATFASVQVDDTFILNGLTFTAKAAENLGARQFSQAGTDAQTATSAAACVTSAFAALGLSAAGNAAVMTVTATTATTTQLLTGVGGARIVCAQVILASLPKLRNAPHFSGADLNSTTAGTVYEVWADGYPHLYVGLTNNDGAAAATFVVGAAILAV